MNRLYYGDNLSIMRNMPKECVDLIYLDPPFKSEQNYNLIYKTLTGKPVPEQAEAFCDTWEMDAEKEQLARTMPMLMREHGVESYYVEFWRLWIKALRNTQPHLLAYLIYMVHRLLHMKIILRPKGSIYLHCDPTASHYIKVMMDGIFGHRNFRNEIIWKRTGAHGSAKRCGPVHDVILFYTASDKYTWNDVRMPLDPDYIERKFRWVDQKTGRKYQDVSLTGPGTRNGESGDPWRDYNPTDIGRHWALPGPIMERERIKGKTLQDKLDALDKCGRIHWPKKRGGSPRLKFFPEDSKGLSLQDVWTDISPINAQAAERLGYPTQKPIALLRRIVEASSNPGDVVFDPFCGCGTTIYAAHELEREWIGCDVAILAVKLVEQQLRERYYLTPGEQFEIDGIPNSVESATALWNNDPFQFEHWSVEHVGGFPTKKTGDKGVDGRIYFEYRKSLRVMVLSVKGGKVRPTDVRDLIGVLSTEPDAELAGFISIQEPSVAMRRAAAKAGVWTYRGVDYPRVQLLTIKEIVEEHRTFEMPTRVQTKGTTGQTHFPFK